MKKLIYGENIGMMRDKIQKQESVNKVRELLYGLVCVLARDNPNLFTRLDKTSLFSTKLKEVSPASEISLADYLNSI